MDAGGRVNEQIQATAPSTSGTLAAIIAAAGGGSGAFPQSASTRWTTNQYTDCCLAASQRVYRKIPASGEGTSGTNYDQTNYGYTVMKRRNRTVLPGGEIAFVVHDVRGLVLKIYVGTNDNGAPGATGGGFEAGWPCSSSSLIRETCHCFGVGGEAVPIGRDLAKNTASPPTPKQWHFQNVSLVGPAVPGSGSRPQGSRDCSCNTASAMA